MSAAIDDDAMNSLVRATKQMITEAKSLYQMSQGAWNPKAADVLIASVRWKLKRFDMIILALSEPHAQDAAWLADFRHIRGELVMEHQHLLQKIVQQDAEAQLLINFGSLAKRLLSMFCRANVSPITLPDIPESDPSASADAGVSVDITALMKSFVQSCGAIISCDEALFPTCAKILTEDMKGLVTVARDLNHTDVINDLRDLARTIIVNKKMILEGADNPRELMLETRNQLSATVRSAREKLSSGPAPTASSEEPENQAQKGDSDPYTELQEKALRIENERKRLMEKKKKTRERDRTQLRKQKEKEAQSKREHGLPIRRQKSSSDFSVSSSSRPSGGGPGLPIRRQKSSSDFSVSSSRRKSPRLPESDQVRRMRLLKEMLDNELVTQEEYDTKRRNIIASDNALASSPKAETAKPQASAARPPESSLERQLRVISELLEAGIIDEEERRTRKAQILREERIRRLDELLANGFISAEEYQEKKRQVLSFTSAPTPAATAALRPPENSETEVVVEPAGKPEQPLPRPDEDLSAVQDMPAEELPVVPPMPLEIVEEDVPTPPEKPLHIMQATQVQQHHQQEEDDDFFEESSEMPVPDIEEEDVQSAHLSNLQSQLERLGMSDDADADEEESYFTTQPLSLPDFEAPVPPTAAAAATTTNSSNRSSTDTSNSIGNRSSTDTSNSISGGSASVDTQEGKVVGFFDLLAAEERHKLQSAPLEDKEKQLEDEAKQNYVSFLGASEPPKSPRGKRISIAKKRSSLVGKNKLLVSANKSGSRTSNKLKSPSMSRTSSTTKRFSGTEEKVIRTTVQSMPVDAATTTTTPPSATTATTTTGGGKPTELHSPLVSRTTVPSMSASSPGGTVGLFDLLESKERVKVFGATEVGDVVDPLDEELGSLLNLIDEEGNESLEIQLGAARDHVRTRSVHLDWDVSATMAPGSLDGLLAELSVTAPLQKHHQETAHLNQAEDIGEALHGMETEDINDELRAMQLELFDMGEELMGEELTTTAAADVATTSGSSRPAIAAASEEEEEDGDLDFGLDVAMADDDDIMKQLLTDSEKQEVSTWTEVTEDEADLVRHLSSLNNVTKEASENWRKSSLLAIGKKQQQQQESLSSSSGNWSIGQTIFAQKGSDWFPATISQINSDGTVRLFFEDGSQHDLKESRCSSLQTNAELGVSSGQVDFNKVASIAERQKLVDSFYEDEREFVAVLLNLQEGYYAPMRAKKSINKDDLSTIFSNVEDLLAVHKQLLANLAYRMAKRLDQLRGELMTYGDLFLQLEEPLGTAYATYIAFFTVSIEELKRSMADKKFRQTLEQIEKESQLDSLSNLLARPMQRLGELLVWMRRLRTATPDNHPDISLFLRGEDSFAHMIRSINRAKATLEDRRKLEKLELRMQTSKQSGFEVLADRRRILYEGLLLHENEGKSYHCVLCNDVFLRAKPGLFGKPMQFKGSFNLIGASVRTESIDEPASSGRFRFRLVVDNLKLDLACSSAELRREWMSAFRDLTRHIVVNPEANAQQIAQYKKEMIKKYEHSQSKLNLFK